MTALPHESLSWLQNGEPVSGGTNGNNEGVLNRPLQQLLSNDDALRANLDATTAEVVGARGTESTLNGRLNSIDTRIDGIAIANNLANRQLESEAELVRVRIPSCFDYTYFTEKREITFTKSSLRDNATKYGFAVQTQTDEGRTADMVNTIALVGNPKPLYVNGHKIVLDQSPEDFASLYINLGEAPETGTRLQYSFLEVWREQVVLGQAGAVLFPYGAVNFTPKTSTTFDGCNLANANITGTYAPAYLATSDGHGYYVRANDNNIDGFVADVKNNVVMDKDGNYYQYRWRVRTVNVTDKDIIHAYEDTSIKAQGMLAAPSAVSFVSVFDDVGLSMASDSTLAKDGNVYAVPLALVHRRNQDTFSVTNMNGSDSYAVGNDGTIRPDNKFYDSVTLEDMLDLRQHGVFDNAFNFQRMVDSNFDRALKGTSNNVFGAWYADPDGNRTAYEDTGIYGTSLLRADCIYGGDSAPDHTWQVQTQLRSPNGVYTKLDGLRNYFGNMPSSQQVFGMIPNRGTGSMSPVGFWTYDNQNMTISFDATAMKSGNNSDNTDVEGVTKVSNKVPSVRFGASMTTLGLNGMEVNGEWSGLGNDNATFTMKDESYFSVICKNTSTQTLNVGDTYTSVNGVTCTLTGYTPDALTSGIGSLGFKFSGSTLPVFGTLTGAAGNTGTFASITSYTSSTRPIYVMASSITGIKINDTYSSDGITYTVREIITSTKLLGLSSQNNGQTIAAGTFTKVSSASGPATFTVASNQLWFDLLFALNGENSDISETTLCSYALMPANCPIYCVASVDFTKGSSVLSDVPFKDNKSYLGCQYWVDGEQLLPNGGKGFVPVGLGDSISLDNHTKTASLQGFLYSKYLLRNSHEPSLLKDIDNYKLYFILGSDIALSTSEDLIKWSEPEVVIEHGSEPNGYDAQSISNPCVIKDGDTYKMWCQGYATDTTKRILYSTSQDGITWETVESVVDGSIFSTISNVIELCSVIKDNSTYKMWVSRNTTSFALLTSSNGTTWTLSDEMKQTYSICDTIFKENTVYRRISVYNDASLNFEVSTDGINWTPDVRFSLTASEITTTGTGFGCSFIKEDSRYVGIISHREKEGPICLWLMVLTITDTSNTGTSTTGTYITAPANLNVAPSDSSKVVLFYKSTVQPSDSALLTEESATFEYEDIQKSSNAIVTSLDPYTTTEPDHIYREAMNTIYPWISLTEANAYGSGKSVGSNNVLMLHSNFNTDSTIIHQLPVFEATTGMQTEGTGDSEVTHYKDGESCNIAALQNSSLYNTASLSDSTYEIASELININKRVIMVIGSSYGSNGFDQSMALCRPLGNPVMK